MSNRLNQKREKELEPKRVTYAREKLEALGYKVQVFGGKRIEFEHEGSKVQMWPYSGWHSGSTITDGRGIKNLLKQLDNNNNQNQ